MAETHWNARILREEAERIQLKEPAMDAGYPPEVPEGYKRVSEFNYVTKDSGKQAEYADGMRRDTADGKAKFTLMFPKGVPYEEQLMTRVAELYERGGQKYGDRNWEKSSTEETLAHHEDALMRHVVRFLLGVEDGEDHAAAIVWNVNAVDLTRRNIDAVEQAEAAERYRKVAEAPVPEEMRETAMERHPAGKAAHVRNKDPEKGEQCPGCRTPKQMEAAADVMREYDQAWEKANPALGTRVKEEPFHDEWMHSYRQWSGNETPPTRWEYLVFKEGDTLVDNENYAWALHVDGWKLVIVGKTSKDQPLEYLISEYGPLRVTTGNSKGAVISQEGNVIWA